MATTLVSDVIVPEIWVPYMREAATYKTALFRSGIIDYQDPELQQLVSGKGASIINMPFWQPMSGDAENLSDSSSLTPKAESTAQDKAVKHFRGDARQWNLLSRFMSGDDPGQMIADKWAQWWAEDMQKNRLIPSLTGIFATTLASSHALDVSIADGNNAAASNKIGNAAIRDSMFLLGDHWMDFDVIVMHSVPFKTLQDLDLITFEPISEQDLKIPTYMGRTVIVDDDCPVVAGGTSGYVYTSYIFQRGSVAFAEENLDMTVGPFGTAAFETDRDILANNTTMVTRRHFVMHPRGVAFTGTPSGQSPTNAELEAGANWTKKYSDKNIRIVQLKTNG